MYVWSQRSWGYLLRAQWITLPFKHVLQWVLRNRCSCNMFHSESQVFFGLWSRLSALFWCNIYITLAFVSFFPVSSPSYKICLLFLFLCISYPVFHFSFSGPDIPTVFWDDPSFSPFLSHRRLYCTQWLGKILSDIVYNLLLVAATLVSVLTELLARDPHKVLLCAILHRSLVSTLETVHWEALKSTWSKWECANKRESLLWPNRRSSVQLIWCILFIRHKTQTPSLHVWAGNYIWMWISRSREYSEPFHRLPINHYLTDWGNICRSWKNVGSGAYAGSSLLHSALAHSRSFSVLLSLRCNTQISGSIFTINGTIPTGSLDLSFPKCLHFLFCTSAITGNFMKPHTKIFL